MLACDFYFCMFGILIKAKGLLEKENKGQGEVKVKLLRQMIEWGVGSVL